MPFHNDPAIAELAEQAVGTALKLLLNSPTLIDDQTTFRMFAKAINAIDFQWIRHEKAVLNAAQQELRELERPTQKN